MIISTMVSFDTVLFDESAGCAHEAHLRDLVLRTLDHEGPDDYSKRHRWLVGPSWEATRSRRTSVYMLKNLGPQPTDRETGFSGTP